MKKTCYIFAALAAVVACNKAEVISDNPEVLMLNPVSSLTVTSSPVVKTATDGTLQVLWSAGDQIAVWGNKREATELATPFTISGSGGANTATFTGDEVDCGEYGIAVYPYVRPEQGSDDKYRKLLTDGTARTWILREQHHVTNSIPTDALVMASRFDPASGTMTFTALASVLEVKLYGEVSVKKIRVEEFAKADAASMGGKNLSGRVDITFDESGVPTAEAGESSYVDYICDTPVVLGTTEATATSFFIVVSGNASFNHLKLIITDGDNKERTVKIKGSGETTTLAPGIVYSLPPKKIEPVPATVLAKWALDKTSYQMGDFYVQNATDLAESGNAVPTAGNGYIKFKNNDWETGAIKTFRTNISDSPATPSHHLCFIPATMGDEIIVAATGCELASGDKVQFLACLWAYASKKQLANWNTSKAYSLEYSLDGTNWTKIKDITFSANATGPTGNEGTAASDINEEVTLSSSSTQVLFRFKSTSNDGTAGGAINTDGQTRICASISKGQLAILKL